MPAGQVLTGDHNLVNVEAAIQYRIRKAEVVSFVLQKENVEGFIARAAETLVGEWIAGRRVDDVLRAARSICPWCCKSVCRGRLEKYELGVEIEQREHHETGAPRQVKKEFEELTQRRDGDSHPRQQRGEDRRGDAQRWTKSKVYAPAPARRPPMPTRNAPRRRRRPAAIQKRLEQYRDLSRKDPDYHQLSVA